MENSAKFEQQVSIAKDLLVSSPFASILLGYGMARVEAIDNTYVVPATQKEVEEDVYKFLVENPGLVNAIIGRYTNEVGFNTQHLRGQLEAIIANIHFTGNEK